MFQADCATERCFINAMQRLISLSNQPANGHRSAASLGNRLVVHQRAVTNVTPQFLNCPLFVDRVLLRTVQYSSTGDSLNKHLPCTMHPIQLSAPWQQQRYRLLSSRPRDILVEIELSKKQSSSHRPQVGFCLCFSFCK